MGLAKKWFNKNTAQNTYAKVSELPVLFRLGPSLNPKVDKQQSNSNGQKYFIVGQSTLEDGSVVR